MTVSTQQVNKIYNMSAEQMLLVFALVRSVS